MKKFGTPKTARFTYYWTGEKDKVENRSATEKIL